MMAGTRYVFILGAPNGDRGELSSTSLSRIDTAVALLAHDPSRTLIATGGFGSHFNRTAHSHRSYVATELAGRGISAGFAASHDFLSANTVEDAIEIVAFASRNSVSAFDVVTSAFHVSRCRLIFGCVAPQFHVVFHVADDPPGLASAVIDHETAASDAIVAQGGVIIGGRLLPLPSGLSG